MSEFVVVTALRRIVGFEGLEASDEIITEVGTELSGKNRDEIAAALQGIADGSLSDARALRYARAIS